jgi:DNA polymerase-3 subunit epsilon
MNTTEAAANRAREILADPNWLILDTETTGLGATDQVIQICLLTPTGRTILDTLIQPTVPTDPEAYDVHGIQDEDLAIAPKYHQIETLLQFHIAGNHIIAYNAPFDIRLLAQTAHAHGLSPIIPQQVTCAMKIYQQYLDVGHRVSLPDAAHSAADDTRAVLALLQRIAAHPHNT